VVTATDPRISHGATAIDPLLANVEGLFDRDVDVVAPGANDLSSVSQSIPVFSADQAALPERFLLGFLRDRRFSVVEPIKVVRTTVDGQSVIEAPEFGEFGFGQSTTEALADLQEAIAQLYVSLRDAEGGLGGDLQVLLHKLQSKLTWHVHHEH
jgi:RecB family exonuclease